MQELPIAVVIPAYNRAALLPRAIASVAAQRVYRPQEIIVVDDASTDGTGAVAAAEGARVLRHDTNRGPAAARNTGFAATDAPWLMQLDSDDEWLPDCLATLWALKADHVLVSGGSFGTDANGRLWFNGAVGVRPQILSSPAALAFPDNFIASSGVLMRADCVRRIGGYRTDLRYAEDLEFWLRLLEFGTGLVTPVAVNVYHSHELQATATAPAAAQLAHARVLAMSVDRSWWRPSLAVRWSAVVHWDALRRASSEGQRRAVIDHATAFIRRPQRLVGLAQLLIYRLRRRRRSAQLATAGFPPGPPSSP